jgi:hypothetical protein
VRGEQYPSTALYFLIKDVVTLSIERLFDGMANMAVIGNVLFRRVDLRDTLQRLEAVRKLIVGASVTLDMSAPGGVFGKC